MTTSGIEPATFWLVAQYPLCKIEMENEDRIGREERQM
jgi:hypothetical protein